MDEKKEYFLMKRYASLFNNESDSSNTMFSYGIACHDGWFNILNSACVLIESHLNSLKKKNMDNLKWLDKISRHEKIPEYIEEKYKKQGLNQVEIPNFKFVQIKEKFGELRCYYEGGDSYIDGVISMLSQMSGITCELCGNSGKIHHGSWIRTLCPTHIKDVDIENEIKPIHVGDSVSVLEKDKIVDMMVTEVLDSNKIKAKKIAKHSNDILDNEEYFLNKLEIYNIWDKSK